MMTNIPKSFKRYIDKGILGEVDTLPAGEEAKFDAILCRGWSFTDDPFYNGQDGNVCSSWHSWATIREGQRELREAKKCDCAACMKAHGGKCTM